MALKINKKQEKKIIKKYSELICNLLLSNKDRTERDLERWIYSVDYQRKCFRKIVNIKKRKLLTLEAIQYIHEKVLRVAWDRYWDKYHDRLNFQKE